MDATRYIEHVLRGRAGILWFFYSMIISCLKLPVFIAFFVPSVISRGYLISPCMAVSIAVLRLCLLALSSFGERPLLLLYASSPLANLLATSINSDTVLGLALPISSTRSERCRPAEKASIALSSEMSSAEFFYYAPALYIRA
jgi:hypothetical protein